MQLPVETWGFGMHCFVALVGFIVVYIAWCSTKVREFNRGTDGIHFGFNAGAHHISFSKLHKSIKAHSPHKHKHLF